MSKLSFADRYAAAGIAPTAEIILKRQTSSDRIVAATTYDRVIELVALFYGLPVQDPIWLRDEFLQDDPTFSLIQNRREAQVLAAIMLNKLIEGGDDFAALSVVVGGVAGRRSPPQAAWLVQSAHDALAGFAISQRKPTDIGEKVTSTAIKNIEQDLAAVAENDWPGLLAALTKVRKESQNSMVTMSAQTTAIVAELSRRLAYQREESQILWWVFSGLSQSLDRMFSKLEGMQAAIVAALDLGSLTTASRVGPIAAPAVLDRVIDGAKKPRVPTALSRAVDGLGVVDLAKLDVGPPPTTPSMMPITAALNLATTMGAGVWYAKFTELTGMPAETVFTPSELSQQLYLEDLLGALL